MDDDDVQQRDDDDIRNVPVAEIRASLAVLWREYSAESAG